MYCNQICISVGLELAKTKVNWYFTGDSNSNDTTVIAKQVSSKSNDNRNIHELDAVAHCCLYPLLLVFNGRKNRPRVAIGDTRSSGLKTRKDGKTDSPFRSKQGPQFLMGLGAGFSQASQVGL